ncbi:MAG: CPBP family intramembrane glutamic endopeptidase [Planctomycetota bacterium]
MEFRGVGVVGVVGVGLAYGEGMLIGSVDVAWLETGLVLAAMAGLVVLVVLAWRGGWWRAGYLGGGPRRPVGLGGLDLLVGLGVLLLGQVVLGVVLAASGALQTGAEGEAGWRALGDGVLVEQGLILMVGQVLTFGVVAGYAVWRVGVRRAGWGRWGLWRGAVSGLGLGLAGVVVVLPIGWLAGVVYWVLAGEEPPAVAHPMLEMMRAASAWWALLPFVVSAVVLAPLFEELVFRGFLQTVLVKRLGWRSAIFGKLGRGRWVGVWLTGVLFGLIHAGGVDPIALPGLVVLGLVLGAYYERTGSLLGCVVGHMVFNAVNVVLALYVVGVVG